MPMLDLEKSLAALHRLVEIVQRDTGQSAKVANFLLSWWNARDCGGFDLTELWALDQAIIDDILTVTALVAARHAYPDAYGLDAIFERLVKDWRPLLVAQ